MVSSRENTDVTAPRGQNAGVGTESLSKLDPSLINAPTFAGQN